MTILPATTLADDANTTTVSLHPAGNECLIVDTSYTPPQAYYVPC